MSGKEDFLVGLWSLLGDALAAAAQRTFTNMDSTLIRAGVGVVLQTLEIDIGRPRGVRTMLRRGLAGMIATRHAPGTIAAAAGLTAMVRIRPPSRVKVAHSVCGGIDVILEWTEVPVGPEGGAYRPPVHVNVHLGFGEEGDGGEGEEEEELPEEVRELIEKNFPMWEITPGRGEPKPGPGNYDA